MEYCGAVYSFHAGRDIKTGRAAPQTLHAVVNGAENDTANGSPGYRENSGPAAGTQSANIDSNAAAPSMKNIRSAEGKSQGKSSGRAQEKSSGRASTQVESREYAELRREYERRAKAWNEANDRNDESFPFASELRWITDAEKRLNEMKEAGATRKRRGSRGSRRILRQRVLRSVKNKIDEHTQQCAAKRGERSGERCPRPASGLFLYGEQRCGARPVYQRKDDDARRRFFCPAVREQYPAHCRGRERPV